MIKIPEGDEIQRIVKWIAYSEKRFDGDPDLMDQFLSGMGFARNTRMNIKEDQFYRWVDSIVVMVEDVRVLISRSPDTGAWRGSYATMNPEFIAVYFTASCQAIEVA